MDGEIIAVIAAVLVVVTSPVCIPLAFLIYALAKWRLSWRFLAWLVAAEVIGLVAADVRVSASLR